MSIEDLTTKENGKPWSEDGREAFTQIAEHALGSQVAATVGAARIDWPGPVLWICTFTPHAEPTNMLDGDASIDFASGA